MKNIVWIFNILVQVTLLMALLLNRNIYMRIIDLDD